MLVNMMNLASFVLYVLMAVQTKMKGVKYTTGYRIIPFFSLCLLWFN